MKEKEKLKSNQNKVHKTNYTKKDLRFFSVQRQL